jgi:hypothetical protein
MLAYVKLMHQLKQQVKNLGYMLDSTPGASLQHWPGTGQHEPRIRVDCTYIPRAQYTCGWGGWAVQPAMRLPTWPPLTCRVMPAPAETHSCRLFHPPRLSRSPYWLADLWTTINSPQTPSYGSSTSSGAPLK